MKLSAFFSDIDLFWQTRTITGAGLTILFFAAGTYAGYQLTRKQESNPLVYGVFTFALLITISVAEKTTTLEILSNPVGVAFLGAVSGAGRDTYRRLSER
jgi:hypothetical protein